jgi:hypothetical protein
VAEPDDVTDLVHDRRQWKAATRLEVLPDRPKVQGVGVHRDEGAGGLDVGEGAGADDAQVLVGKSREGAVIAARDHEICAGGVGCLGELDVGHRRPQGEAALPGRFLAG